MATISTLSTPIATPMVGKDGMIDPVWNEFFVRFMITAGIKVSIDDLETDTTSLQTQIDAIDVEAVGSITMTDSDSNGSATLAKLYDGNRTSDGVAYTLSGVDKYLEYKFGMKSYVDRISLWVADANARIYIAYSDDGSAWTYLSAESDHTLDSEGRLVNATSQSNAATDYFQPAAGQNNALFPNNISALYIRLYMTGTYSTTVYEFIPSRILIAEMAAIENLAVLSATFGPVGGYASITDKPATLSAINAAEGTKFAGIATGADVSPGLPSDENLVGYWSIDESSGTVIKDSSGKGNDGVLDSGVFGTGVSGNCIDLDYTTYDHIIVADNSELDFDTGDFSISCWAKINAFQAQGSSYNCILYRGSLSATAGCQFGFAFTSVGTVRFIAGDVDFIATGLDDLTDNLWHHIVGVRESEITKIYIDTVKGTDSTSALNVNGSEDFIIGGNNGSGRYLDGSVDEVRLYDKALSLNEIKALYLNPSGQKSPTPGADVTFDAQGNLQFSPSDNMITNPDFEIDMQGWTSNGTYSIKEISDGAFGGNVFEAVGGTTTLKGIKYIPIDPSKIYYGEIWVKVTAIDTTDGYVRMYAGVENYDYNKDITTDDGDGGVRNRNSYFLNDGSHAYRQVTVVDTEFIKITGIITGTGTGYDEFAGDVKYVRPFVLCSYQATAGDGEMQIAFMRFTEVNLDADVTADAAVIGTMQTQIDGKVIAWFQASASDPADDWTTNDIKDIHVNDTWYKTDLKLLYWYNSSYVWTLVEDQKALDAYSDAASAQAAADAAQTAADNAQNDADDALAELTDIADDGEITPVEKLTLKPMWDAIITEATLVTGTLIVQAAAAGADDSDFDAAYAALYTYLITTLGDVFTPMTDTTSIVRSTWDGHWTLYWDERTNLINAIADKGYDLADGKRRVFVATPTVPYDVGDLWDTGTGVSRCSTAKTAAQAYSSVDWAVAATDDAFLASGYTTIVGDVISVFSATISIVADENDMLDWIENSTTEVATLTPSTTYTPTTLAAHIQTKMRAEGDADTTVTYNSTTKKITIANSTLTTLSLLWNTGTNADENCGNALGFSIVADDTGALTYTADTKAALRVLIGDLS